MAMALGGYLKIRRQQAQQSVTPTLASPRSDLSGRATQPSRGGTPAAIGSQAQPAANTPAALGPDMASVGLERWTVFPPAALSVSEPGDADERAADALADQVLQAPAATEMGIDAEAAQAPTAGVLRDAAPGASTFGSGADVSLPSAGGGLLPEPVRAAFEPRFGHDFSQVRVYADAPAAKAAEALDARAFTIGSSVVFGAGQYAPHTTDGQRLLAHELAHVVQGGSDVRTLHRWHDADHMQTTQDAINAVGAPLLVPIFNPSGQPGPYDSGAKIIARLKDASINMDRFFPHPLDNTKESHNVGRLLSGVSFLGSAVTMGIGRGIGNLTGARKGRSDSRGVFGEGPDHGEAGRYTRGPGCEPENEAREDHYINLSVNALNSNNIDLALNKLGDAFHVSADRGSHGEGIKGRGHDTPAPGPDENGTHFPDYMENLNDCDNRALNPVGYAYGLGMSVNMLLRFLQSAPVAQQPVQQPPQQPAQGGGDQGDQGGGGG